MDVLNAHGLLATATELCQRLQLSRVGSQKLDRHVPLASNSGVAGKCTRLLADRPGVGPLYLRLPASDWPTGREGGAESSQPVSSTLNSRPSCVGCARDKHRQSSAKRTDEASRGGASSSDRRRNCPQDVPENAGLHLKRLGAVVLIVSRRHHDNEIEFRDDANRLPAATKRASPVDLTPIERGAAEPPEIPIGQTARDLDLPCRRGLDPVFGNDLTVVPASARKDQLTDFCHVAWSQAQSSSGIGIPPDPIPLDAGNALRFEQRC